MEIQRGDKSERTILSVEFGLDREGSLEVPAQKILWVLCYIAGPKTTALECPVFLTAPAAYASTTSRDFCHLLDAQQVLALS